MSETGLFVDTEPLFGDVEELRRSFRDVETVEGLQPVSLSNASAAETLTTVVGLAASLPASFGSQLELIARSMALGALRVLAADHLESED